MTQSLALVFPGQGSQQIGNEEKRLCVCDISDILGMTISAVSQHLRKLKDRKLIETEREAQTIFYSLTKEYEKMLKPFFKL